MEHSKSQTKLFWMGWVLKSKENIKKHSINKRDDKPGHNKLSELPQDIMKGPQEICESAGSHETETDSQALVLDIHTWMDCGWENLVLKQTSASLKYLI